jgi:hypothetical protein
MEKILVFLCVIPSVLSRVSPCSPWLILKRCLLTNYAGNLLEIIGDMVLEKIAASVMTPLKISQRHEVHRGTKENRMIRFLVPG